MANPYDRVSVNGHTLNRRTLNMLQCAEDRLGYSLNIVQGSYNTGVSASAGTHDGGGAVDVSATSNPNEVVLALREVGFAAWHRPYNWDGHDGGEHIHMIAIGDKQMSSGAATQIREYYDGQNGLANHDRDNGPRLNPIPTWVIKFPTVLSPIVITKFKSKNPGGSKNVKRVQEALRGRGYYKGSVDGVAGHVTRKAFDAFLTCRKLTGGVSRSNLKVLCKGYNKVV